MKMWARFSKYPESANQHNFLRHNTFNIFTAQALLFLHEVLNENWQKWKKKSSPPKKCTHVQLWCNLNGIAWKVKCGEIEANGSFHVIHFHWFKMLKMLRAVRERLRRYGKALISVLFTPYFMTFQTPLRLRNEEMRASWIFLVFFFRSYSHSNNFYDLSAKWFVTLFWCAWAPRLR